MSDPQLLERGSKAWREEVLRLAAECERLGLLQAASLLRMEEFYTPDGE